MKTSIVEKMSKMSETSMVPIFSGATAYAIGMAMYPEDAFDLPAVGTVSAPVGLAVASGVGAAIGQVGGNYILPYIPRIGGYANVEKRIAAPLASGAATWGIAKLGGNQRAGSNLFVIGAASDLVGQYAYDTLMK